MQKKAVKNEDVSLQFILGQHVVNQSSSQVAEDIMKAQNKRAQVRANADVNTMMHNQRILEK